MKRNVDETRRRFMAHFASIGLGASLVPGVLWARMQDAGAQQITLAMVTDSLKLAGLDFSVLKTTSLTEKVHVQFRAEFFKLFNTAIFSNPAANIDATTFGKISSTIDNTGRSSLTRTGLY